MLENYKKLVKVSKSLDETLLMSKASNYNQTTEYEKDLESLDTALEMLVDTIKTINLNLTLNNIIGLPVCEHYFSF